MIDDSSLEICSSSPGTDIYILGPFGLSFKRADNGWHERIPEGPLVRKWLDIAIVLLGNRQVMRCVLGRLAVWAWIEREPDAQATLERKPE